MKFIVTIQQQLQINAIDAGMAKQLAEENAPYRHCAGGDFSLKTIPKIQVMQIEPEDGVNHELSVDGKDSMKTIQPKGRICTTHIVDMGECFVETDYGYDRISLDQAEGQRVIPCYFCDNPAVELDHLWPYFSNMNRCEEHRSS